MPLRTREAILDDLTSLTSDLASQREELADLLATEHAGRIQSWMAADEDTLKGRDRIADFNVLNLTTDIIRLKGQIAANEDRRTLLIEQLHYAPSSAQ